MCGFAGFWNPQGFASVDALDTVTAMSLAIRHRGPDGEGAWADDSSGVALSHRRLSILDLSPAGRQPMVSANGRFVIAFNGEIYNHLELRKQLGRPVEGADRSDVEGPKWRGHSDTETLLAAFEEWGFERALEKTVGMFAFALWDRESRALRLARDRIGEKPLYYGWQRGIFVFGSELKALKKHPAFSAEIDRGSLALLLRHNYIPAPRSIYKSINKLLPGTFLQLDLKREPDGLDPLPEPIAYWSLGQAIEAGRQTPFVGSDSEAVDVLESQLRRSVGLQMVADVPLGAFLSGGIDSSTVVALMQAQSSRPIKTFTIGFNEEGFNEANFAKAVARHLATDHTELYVTAAQAQAVIPKLPSIYCEPFADSSQIPTYLVSQLARTQVKVSLSGDAGDELFGGYHRYLLAMSVWRKAGRLPPWARRSVSAMLENIPASTFSAAFRVLSPLLPKRLQLSAPEEKARKLASVLRMEGGEEFYRSLVSLWQRPSDIVIGAVEPSTLLNRPQDWPVVDGMEHWMMGMDALTYLPDDVLVKVDRAAMATSLETRVPLLDHRLVEFAWSLPLHFKIRNGEGKWLLRQVLYRHVPREMFERPKMGFGVPLDAWLRGPLRDWAENLLDENRLNREGYFRAAPIRKMWAEHLSGRTNSRYSLWTILMFQAWLEHQNG
jgi:asparagine synthase (glutamine-hydrolysing)